MLKAIRDCDLYQIKEFAYDPYILNFEDEHGSTPLIEASNDDYIPQLKTLLNSDKININFVNKYGLTALTWACIKNSPIAVRLLLSAGADAGYIHGDGDTMLIIPCVSGNIAIVRLLLETGNINIKHKNNCGDTALDLAKRNDDEIVAMLGDYLSLVNKGWSLSVHYLLPTKVRKQVEMILIIKNRVLPYELREMIIWYLYRPS